MDLGPARAAVADTLTAAGIRAVTEPRAIVAPCALVEMARHIDAAGLGGARCSATCTITVTLIAPATDQAWLDRHVVTAMTAAGATTADLTPYFMGDDARLPAYVMTATVTVTGE